MPASRRLWISTCILLISASVPGAAHAFRNGITGFSGKTSGVNCNSCHAGGTAPIVDFEGPTTVAPGSTNTYRFNVRSQVAGQTGAGLDVAVSGGTLAVASEQGARVLANEIVHNAAKGNVDGVATWEFSWTVPAAEGTATLFGSGNSVNGDDGTFGDRATSTTLAVQVVAAVDTPTPSPTPTVPRNTPTATATSGPIPCVGDCDDGGTVVVNELVTGVNIALDRVPVTQCPDFDIDGSETVSVNELVSGVNALLRGCDPEL